jgi:hypothetical protein
MDFVVSSRNSLWSEAMGARDVFSRTGGHYVNITNIYHSHGAFPFWKHDNNYTLPPYQFKFRQLSLLLGARQGNTTWTWRLVIHFRQGMTCSLRCDVTVVLVKSQNYTADAWSKNNSLSLSLSLSIYIYIYCRRWLQLTTTRFGL